MSYPVLGCPRCRTQLVARALPAGVAHACGACGGVWLDHAASQRATAALCDQTLALGDALSAAAPWRVDVAAGLGCPVCVTPLSRTLVEGARVEIDTCAQHGTWFDRDELGHVGRALAARRAYGGAAAAAAVGAGALAVGAAASMDPALAARPRTNVDAAEMAEVAVDGAEVAYEVGAAGGEVAGAVLESSGDVIGGVFDILGGLFS